MYAITFDLNTEMLRTTYHNGSFNNAYNDIKNTLREFGFERQQGSVYFGNSTVTAVTCFTATNALTSTYAWFRLCVRDIRMLRIEEINDLMPLLTTQKIKKHCHFDHKRLK